MTESFKPLNAYTLEYTLYQDDDEGLIIQVNTGFQKAMGHPDYPIKVGVAVPVHPEHDVGKLKNDIEDTLQAMWNQSENGHIVATIIGLEEPEFIEFLSYAKEKTDFAETHQTLEKFFPDEDIQMYAEQDAEWETYRELCDPVID